jgi:hypothetical protein
LGVREFVAAKVTIPVGRANGIDKSRRARKNAAAHFNREELLS